MEETELSEAVLLRAILALLVDERTRALGVDTKPRSTELMLSASGLDFKAIAAIVGKKPDAVRMMISRNTQKES